MTKRLVLSGYFGFKNFGDEAILSVLINKLQEHDTEITVISSNPEYTKKQYNNINCIKTFDLKNIIYTIYKSNILISGGGSLLQDVTSLKSLFYYLVIIFIGLFLGKKVIIFAQGIGPVKSAIGTFFAKNILKHCTYISVRDEKSFKLLESWGIKSDLLCDPVFDLKVPDTKKNKTLGIQLRNCKGMNMDFLDRLADIIYKKFNDYNIEIYSFQDEIDLQICKDFIMKLNMLNSDIKITLLSGLTNNQIISKLSECEYLISMRFHAIIVGIMTGVKTLCINYDIKVDKLAKEFDLPIIDLKNDFNNQFNLLINQNLFEIKNKCNNKKFNWSGFEDIIK